MIKKELPTIGDRVTIDFRIVGVDDFTCETKVTGITDEGNLLVEVPLELELNPQLFGEPLCGDEVDEDDDHDGDDNDDGNDGPEMWMIDLTP